MTARTVITYGTFDLFHVGHLNILRRLAEYGDRLVVGVSTDAFNAAKGKESIHTYEQRADIVGSLRMVSEVFPEHHWDQKRDDIVRFGADIFGMGDDWRGKFDSFNDLCEVVYLPRTEGVSSTQIKSILKSLDSDHVKDLKNALDLISNIVSQLE